MANGPTPTEARHLRTLFSLGAAGTLTDGQLLERFAARNGDPSELAFSALIERHGSMVLRVARAVLLDEHSAHDTFQATFLILARKARSLWVRDSLGPWLHAVAFRVASQSRSLEGRRKLLERKAFRLEAFRSREWDRSDLARAIHEEIERLPQPYRLAVVTCHLENLTQHEAAHRLGWPVGTLQSRLARGRQRLRDRLQRRGYAPSLAVLAGKLSPVPSTLTAATAKAASTLYQGGTIAGMIAPTVLAMIETTTKGMLMTKLKFGALALLMACGIAGSGMGLGIGRPAKATDGPTRNSKVEITPGPGPAPLEPIARKSIRLDEPTLTIPQPNPKPWETAVRIKIHLSDQEWSFGSGTVIRSSAEDSIILTCGHIFRLDGKKQPLPKGFRFPIMVDLFDCRLSLANPSMVNCIERDIPGEVIDYEIDELGNDVGLIRIRPGRKLTASPVVSPEQQPTKGSKMVAVGCSQGNDATAWDTTILDFFTLPGAKEIDRKLTLIQCEYRPKQGRDGGGLFTIDGHVAGVYSRVDPDRDAGYYSGPEAIYRLLGRNGLDTPGPRTASAGDSPWDENPPPKPLTRTTPGEEPANPPLVVEEAPKPIAPTQPPTAGPKPWETVVRVNLITTGRPDVRQSGTIIHSTTHESILMTAARDLDAHQASTGESRSKITVDLFDGKLTGLHPPAVGLAQPGYPAEILILDRAQDLAILRINPGRLLPASRLVHETWEPRKGMKLDAVGCSTGEDATIQDTEIVEPQFAAGEITTGKIPYYRQLMACIPLPNPGRVGGGLFTAEGYLAGIHLNDAADKLGLYARPETIRNLLAGYQRARAGRRANVTADNSTDTGKYFESELPNSRAEPGPVLPQPVPPDPPINSASASPVALKPGAEQEPTLLEPVLPRPWETVVRIKVHHSAKEWGFGSGTIISSSAEESIILTCTHHFRVRGGNQPSAKDYKVPISVDLFGGQFVRRGPAMLACKEKDIPGEAIDYDFANDVCLIRIRPGRQLPASRVVPPAWQPGKGMKMVTVGCSHGNDATAWDTQILEPRVSMSNTATSQNFEMIKCAFQPREGRSGGGLYTTDGHVAGVCAFADPNEHAGLYASPEAIRKLLDRNGLSGLYEEDRPGNRETVAEGPIITEPATAAVDGGVIVEEPLLTPVPVFAPNAIRRTADQDRRIDDLERKLDRVLKVLEDLKKGGKANEPPKEDLPRVES